MHWKLIDSKNPNDVATSIPTQVDTARGRIKMDWATLRGGKREGVQVLTIDNGLLRVDLLPTRGMGVWKMYAGERELGWQSPVQGPIHPQWVPVFDPNGLGWLEGFDELLVRCGLHSNGAPDFTNSQQLKYPLHGRIANLPTHDLQISIDAETGTLDVVGIVDETRFLIGGLSLRSHLQMKMGESLITIHDTVTNLSATPGSMQMLYHVNVGQPILESGSKVHAACQQLAPRNAHAASTIEDWQKYLPPTDGFVEQVYFAQAIADSSGWSTAALVDSQASNGLAVRFDTRTLPYLNIWKNTAAIEDGYVTGLEPATGFPNPRSFEEAQGRVVPLAAGESRTFRLQLESLGNPQRAAEVLEEIAQQQCRPMHVFNHPLPQWSAS